ncbi:DUF3459 domain-containing protein [Actinotalea ferrariae]|uniref:alpha-amylase family glycosyl hydrolase n=1 Tax=Actinotalea ferrariae TaxID=1386098 RepID=UPI001C8BF16F|nr:alpha-amylase family glycosyl hydrolase [Actinotalea ferrariae]MBX9246653.1 DUF3459 domain-containing protein [Actinotalea ferrariae]
MPGWVEHALWWHVYPLGFVGAEPAAVDGPPVSRLPRITAWFDHVVELGLSGVALGPVFASETHGYDTVDHFAVDARLGTEEDLVALVEAAHARGLRVTLDGVFNHVGRGFARFQDVLREGPGPADRWFRLHWPEGAGPGTEPQYVDFEGHHALVALDHHEPAVVDHVVAVMNHWLARGVDGWRLDAAYAVPTSFWAQVLPRVRAEHPDAYVFGEVLHGDYVGTVAEAGFDAVTQYELWKAIWSSINDRNFFELAWALRRHDEFLEHFVPVTFVGNHDVTRIASRITDERHLAHAVVLLLTLGGTPTIYAGDELGMRGVKEDRAGGDDAVRPEFPPDPATAEGRDGPVHSLHRELVALRRRHPWLHRAPAALLETTNDHLAYRVEGGGEALVVVLNLADDAVTLDLPGCAVEAGRADVDAHDGGSCVVVPGHGWAVLAER